MPRAPRLVEPGGIYHVTSRGNDGRWIFLEDSDREGFLLRLEKSVLKYRWVVFAYCLMDNHIHVLLRVPEDGLSDGMRDLLGGYARSWNRKHGHRGHLFGERFYDDVMIDDSQFLTTASYIDLNPVRAKLCFRPEQWPWSSYRAHVGLDHPPRLLANAEFLKHLGPTPDMARRAYRRFVAERRSLVPGTALDAAPLAANQR